MCVLLRVIIGAPPPVKRDDGLATVWFNDRSSNALSRSCTLSNGTGRMALPAEICALSDANRSSMPVLMATCMLPSSLQAHAIFGIAGITGHRRGYHTGYTRAARSIPPRFCTTVYCMSFQNQAPRSQNHIPPHLQYRYQRRPPRSCRAVEDSDERTANSPCSSRCDTHETNDARRAVGPRCLNCAEDN